jgi:hypothetical protein
MRVEDLMIGNCLKWKDNGSIFEVTIDLLCDKDFHNHFNNGDFEPIALSEEILLKCGFIYFKSNNSYQLDTIHGFSFWGRVVDGFNCYCQSEEFGITIKHLHELQNLYKILTKQELGIKW